MWDMTRCIYLIDRGSSRKVTLLFGKSWLKCEWSRSCGYKRCVTFDKNEIFDRWWVLFISSNCVYEPSWMFPYNVYENGLECEYCDCVYESGRTLNQNAVFDHWWEFFRFVHMKGRHSCMFIHAIWTTLISGQIFRFYWMLDHFHTHNIGTLLNFCTHNRETFMHVHTHNLNKTHQWSNMSFLLNVTQRLYTQ